MPTWYEIDACGSPALPWLFLTWPNNVLKIQVQLIGVSVNHMPWLVVQEFMRFGDLRNVLTVRHLQQRVGKKGVPIA